MFSGICQLKAGYSINGVMKFKLPFPQTSWCLKRLAEAEKINSSH